MNSADILALTPGTQLDQAVNAFIFGNANPTDRFSTDDAAGAKILDRMSLFVGRIDSGPKFSPGRPWIAGVLAWEPTVSGYVTRLSVTAPTRLVALCKAALLVIFHPAKSDRAPVRVSSADAARELAARIGTPGARNPAAGVRAAEEAAEKRRAAKQAQEDKAARKSARMAGLPVPKRGAVPAAPQPAPAPRRGPVVPQPAVFTGARGRRQPMPVRPKEFIGAQPIDTGGNDKQ